MYPHVIENPGFDTIKKHDIMASDREKTTDIIWTESFTREHRKRDIKVYQRLLQCNVSTFVIDTQKGTDLFKNMQSVIAMYDGQ